MNHRIRMGADAALAAGALVLAFGLSLRLLIGTAPPVPGAPVLVVGPPWHGVLDDAVRQGGGALIGPIQAPVARVAVFEGAVPQAALRESGVWAVLDARRLAEICGWGER